MITVKNKIYSSIKFLKDTNLLSDEEKYIIIKENLHYYKFLGKLSTKIQLLLLDLNSTFISIITDFNNKEIRKEIIKILKKEGHLIRFIKNPNKKMIIAAIYNNPKNIKHIKIKLSIDYYKMAIGLNFKTINLVPKYLFNNKDFAIFCLKQDYSAKQFIPVNVLKEIIKDYEKK